MKKILKITLLLILFCNTSIAEDKKYSQKTCEEIYGAIGYFLKVADDHWKKTKDEDKAMKYSQTAANYTTIYQAFCK